MSDLLPRDFFEKRERHVARLYSEFPTDPQVLFLLSQDVLLQEWEDITPEDAASGDTQFFLIFVRRALILAPEGTPCDETDHTLGYEIAAYPADKCGQVTNEWAWRYEERATSVSNAARRLRHRVANGLADKTRCFPEHMEAQVPELPEPLSLDDTARFMRLVESPDSL